MPPKRRRSNLDCLTIYAITMRNRRARRTDEQIQQDNLNQRVRTAQLRESQSQEARAKRCQQRRLEQRQARWFTINTIRLNDLQRQQVHQEFISHSFLRLAFHYEPDIEYYSHLKVSIGAMDRECPHCNALKLKNEQPGMCCASGKVQLPAIETQPELLNNLLINTHPDSNLFLKSIRTFNSCFQMTSFGATQIVQNYGENCRLFNSTFKIKGQVYHKIGSLLPMPNEPHKFLQIY
ncbi:PREDICTED: uncharacterized protein LOC107072460 [Polistes dominula]|uniref:Uncharacterized protein LOC107072460 n=1 Tax=Polistes dominula TaxID=743375 RepID=A0ABM1J626_POLDO|nr:PREDICTED: uncharacterized protein LOC107072460 [Polistes dominula]